MAQQPRFIVQSFRRRRGELELGEAYEAQNEDAVFRRGRVMIPRVAGMVFFKIETSAAGDVWTEVEVIGSVGEVPSEAA